MALLGLFSKRDKSKTSASSTTTGKSSSASVAESETSEYVLPDRNVPSAPNPVYGNGPPEASSSKFHLGFRKRSAPSSDVTENKNLLCPPPIPPKSTARSEANLSDLRPPDKGDLFSGSNSALSTRALPNQGRGESPLYVTKSMPDSTAATRTSTELPPVPKKQGGLFAWAHKERKKSKVADSPPTLNVDVGDRKSVV